MEVPELTKKCAKLLEMAVRENKADPKNPAYLTDGISVFKKETTTIYYVVRVGRKYKIKS